ncbi:LPS export ABC transporter periplasmic protein LptC [Candidatus Spongiihabitans sp.]|uniref:LPS export ABC transporter periplasmic protein LptC n=1 Tax=Candidatus Spongiihabitans sp. TaxID=3101308 RepID=UPI003C7E5B45
MEFKDNISIGAIFLGLVLLSIWLRFGLLEEPNAGITEAEKNNPDYYAEMFVSSGLDESGKKYRIIADRMMHYPVDGRALLDNPHIIQYDLENNPRHIYAESGWLYDNQSTVLLTGNVRVIDNQLNGMQSSSASGTVAVQKMVIHLRDKGSS